MWKFQPSDRVKDRSLGDSRTRGRRSESRSKDPGWN